MPLFQPLFNGDLYLGHLQLWLTGGGLRLQVADFVPDPHPICQWADTFPWAALIEAIEKSFSARIPNTSSCGCRPVATRVLLALELFKHELGASDEQMGIGSGLNS